MSMTGKRPFLPLPAATTRPRQPRLSQLLQCSRLSFGILLGMVDWPVGINWLGIRQVMCPARCTRRCEEGTRGVLQASRRFVSSHASGRLSAWQVASREWWSLAIGVQSCMRIKLPLIYTTRWPRSGTLSCTVMSASSPPAWGRLQKLSCSRPSFSVAFSTPVQGLG